jgi:hypothetical protein
MTFTDFSSKSCALAHPSLQELQLKGIEREGAEGQNQQIIKQWCKVEPKSTFVACGGVLTLRRFLTHKS